MAVMTLVKPIRTLALALSLALAGATPAGAQTESSIAAQDGGTIEVQSGGVTATVRVKAVQTDIRFVRRAQSGWLPVEGPIPFGEPFKVEVRYDAIIPDTTVTIELEAEGAPPLSVDLERVEAEPTVFRSATIVLVAPDLDSQ